MCLVVVVASQPGCRNKEQEDMGKSERNGGQEQRITRGHRGRVLTNTGVWSPDGEWIAYDTRSDAAGEKFDGETIEAVNVRTGEVKELYRSSNGAHCGVVTWHPKEWKVVFIAGPENPDPDWQYAAWHRHGLIVSGLGSLAGERRVENLDGRDVTPPYTAGALRGGSHVHVWDAAGDWVSYTYEDHVLAQLPAGGAHDANLRNIGVSIPGRPVQVPQSHPRNQDGTYFSVLVTRTSAQPRPGSDEISRACEEGWVGTNGYVRRDGTRQRRALAFQGHVMSRAGQKMVEVFIVDLPEDLTVPGEGPLQGTETRMPWPPRGCVQRRVTFTAERAYPGIQGPRHWLRSSPDGSAVAFLMQDDEGLAQLWTVSPNGGAPRQLTRNRWPINSAFTWSPDGRTIGHVMDSSVCVTDAVTGSTRRLTRRGDDATGPRPEACVFSPDGKRLAYIRHVLTEGQPCNQIFVCETD